MTYNIIPARKGSKRFKNKNRKLLYYTLDELPPEEYKQTIITTDDPAIKKEVSNTDVKVLDRDNELANDEASMKDVLIDVRESFGFITKQDIFVLLYLTYPGRSYTDIEEARKFFDDHNSKSLLCRQPVKSHPYLCMYQKNNNRGSQIVEHNLYRYQDYPEVFELSHFISIMEAGVIEDLNPNLYNEDTVYFPLRRNVVDVDYKSDFDEFLRKHESE